MKINAIGITTVIAASIIATAASAQSVTPEDVTKLPVGTKYENTQNKFQLTRTAKGFNFTSAQGINAECNNVTKAGGRGNATINCTAANKNELRFEWVNINTVKLEAWESMAHKAGQTQNKPAGLTSTLTRK